MLVVYAGLCWPMLAYAGLSNQQRAESLQQSAFPPYDHSGPSTRRASSET